MEKNKLILKYDKSIENLKEGKIARLAGGLGLAFSSLMNNPDTSQAKQLPQQATTTFQHNDHLLDIIINGLAKTESNNNNNAIGDDGQAIGALQIWTVVIDDVNRLLGKQKYTYEDRKNFKKSKEIAKIYLKHYCSPKRLGRSPNIVDYAITWNGGPKAINHIIYNSKNNTVQFKNTPKGQKLKTYWSTFKTNLWS